MSTSEQTTAINDDYQRGSENEALQDIEAQQLTTSLGLHRTDQKQSQEEKPRRIKQKHPFKDPIQALQFARSTLRVLATQIIYTGVWVILVVHNENMNSWYNGKWTEFAIAFAIFLVLSIIVNCFPKPFLRPSKLVGALVGTVITTVMVICFSIAFANCNKQIATAWWGTMMAMAFSTSIYTYVERKEFNYGKACLVQLVVIPTTASTFCIVYDDLKFWQTTFWIIIVVIFLGWYVVNDMDSFLCKRKKEFTPQSYVLAALMIYSDIALIFVIIFNAFSTSPEGED